MKNPCFWIALLTVPVGAADGPSVQSSVPTGPFPGPVRLMLPPSIPALEGLETNLYFDNAGLMPHPAAFLPDVTCAKGSQQNARWTWIPKPAETGDHPLTLEFRDGENRVVARGNTVVQVKARKPTVPPAGPVSLLILGDSLTAASVYSQRILDLAAADGLPIRLIGTRGPWAERGDPPTANRHEGYGGWTAERFATAYTGVARGGPYRECGSPFLYRDEGDEAPRLDFARYCRECNGGEPPDFVTILLGCNDTFSAADETIDARIDTMFRHYETLVTMIRAFGPDTRIGAVPPMPPAATQDAFGANYGSGQTRWQYRRNQHRVVERMLETFGGREGGGVFLVPAWLNLDPVHGFPSVTERAHSHAATEVTRQSNGVHPSAEGYRQIGDAVYAWLRSCEG
jgi:lysophospholipase L1-like esterase